MHLHIHGFRIGTLARFSFLAEVKRAHSFLQASVKKKKITVGASVKGNKTLMWMGRIFLIKGPIPFKIHLTRAL